MEVVARSSRLLIATIALLGIALLPAAAGAKTVTIGSPMASNLTGPFSFVAQQTAINTSLSGAPVAAPTDGTITRWRVVGNGTFRLRVLDPQGGNQFKGAGTSASGVGDGVGVEVFETSLPIKAGQLIGLDAETGSIVAYQEAAAQLIVTTPQVPEGSTPASTSSALTKELQFNADIETPDDPAPGGPGPGGGGSPGGGSADGGSLVTVTPPCVVPNLRGKHLGGARKALKAAGCKLGSVRRAKGAGKRAAIKHQSPSAGRSLPAGSKVAVKLG